MPTSYTTLHSTPTRRIVHVTADLNTDAEDVVIAHGFSFASADEAKARLQVRLAAMHSKVVDDKWYIKSIDQTNLTLGKGATSGLSRDKWTDLRVDLSLHSMFV